MADEKCELKSPNRKAKETLNSVLFFSLKLGGQCGPVECQTRRH